MKEKLPHYVYRFTHLRRDNKNGGAPHKPILLLSIIRLFEEEIIKNNQIFILPELVGSFKSNWTRLVYTNHHSIFAMPFYHMRSEPFWKLVPNVGYEKWMELKSSIRSLNNLTAAVNHVLIDDELTELLLHSESRDILKMSILDTYFPDTKYNCKDDDLPNVSILNENSEEYKRKIIELRNKVDDNSFQEEVFIRGGLFKKEIPKIYNNTCAISGLRVDALTDISMVDACHIVPFSQGYDDTLTNGIALSPNLHRAFDRGLISISNNYKVILNKTFVENLDSAYNLTQFKGTRISLPKDPNHHPSLANFSQHRKKFNF